MKPAEGRVEVRRVTEIRRPAPRLLRLISKPGAAPSTISSTLALANKLQLLVLLDPPLARAIEKIVDGALDELR
jgi:hypothetical protein